MKIKLNDTVGIDLEKLIESRLLVQANSGGGKSHTIRRIIEQAFGHVQIIVIDPEGEFSNLRSKFDFVYVGKGGDAPAESRSAALLAKRLLELKASAIVDLYELPPQERKHFVHLFCDAMVNAPKELWHDTLVIIDEAHVFAPEKGESEAMGSVIDLATRGRKRGYCVVLATQRLPKLNKDAAAECNNKLIGRASQDIDRKRAAEELGFTTKEQILSLRDLEPGEFYVFGPAIGRDVIKTFVGDVDVKPPKRGVTRSAPPTPSDAVKKILSQLSDLPKEAAEELRTTSELKREVTRLNRELIKKDRSTTNEAKMRAMVERENDWSVTLREANEEIKRLGDILTSVASKVGVPVITVFEKPISRTSKNDFPMEPKERPMDSFTPIPEDSIQKVSPKIDGEITGPEQRILDGIAMLESSGVREPSKTLVAAAASYSIKSSSFIKALSQLRSRGLINESMHLSDEARDLTNFVNIPITSKDLHKRILSILSGPEKRVLDQLLLESSKELNDAELAAHAQYSPNSSSYIKAKSQLRSKGLLVSAGGLYRASDILFI